jgi:hypothetical protein
MGQNVFVTVVMGSRIVSIFPHFGNPLMPSGPV